ncbi:MAG: GSU2204 family CXXCH-containing (seleno)protein [Vicinamibacterales bacterium]|nr:GSU2204 family CXXCH-containing (seleno)protein [Vicinamibacterales bacterium]
MSMRLLLNPTLSLALVAALSGSVRAQAPQQKPEGSIFIGANVGSNTDNLNRVAEWDVAKKGTVPTVHAQIWGGNESFTYDVLASHSGDNRDQKYGAAFRTANGRVKANVSFDRFLHRLDHDPLDYLDAGIGNFVVRATDHNPGDAYESVNGFWKADIELAATEHIRFFASHSMQMADGMRQTMTMSHCANCHVDSYSRKLDQTTQTLAAGARFNAGGFSADYTFENRTFEEKSATLTHTYDNARHPVSLADMFLNRVQYDDGNGPLPFDLIPKQTKRTNSLRAAYAFPGAGAISAGLTQSTSENDTGGFGADFLGVNGRLMFPLGKKAHVKAFFRRYEIETDRVFVDVVEPVAPAGPSAGLTYAQLYPAMLPLDYTTEPTGSRTPMEMALELAYRPTKRSSINLGYEFESIEREFFHVEKTTTSTFKGSANFRPDKTLTLRARAELAMTSDAFANVHAALPAILQTTPTPGGLPFGPLSLQYFEMYASRKANLAASPTDALLVDGGMTWSPTQKLTVSGHYRFRDMKNDELNFSDWSHAIHMPGVEVYVAPNDRITLAAGWGYQKDTLDTVFATLNFGG